MMSIETFERVGAIFELLVWLLLPIWLVVRIDGWKGVLWGGGVFWLLPLLIAFWFLYFDGNGIAFISTLFWFMYGWVFSLIYAGLIYGVKSLFRYLRVR